MFKKYIAVLLLLSIILSSCGNYNDSVRNPPLVKGPNPSLAKVPINTSPIVIYECPNPPPTECPNTSPVNPLPTECPSTSPVNPPPTECPSTSPVNPPPGETPVPSPAPDFSPIVSLPTFCTLSQYICFESLRQEIPYSVQHGISKSDYSVHCTGSELTCVEIFRDRRGFPSILLDYARCACFTDLLTDLDNFALNKSVSYINYDDERYNVIFSNVVKLRAEEVVAKVKKAQKAIIKFCSAATGVVYYGMTYLHTAYETVEDYSIKPLFPLLCLQYIFPYKRPNTAMRTAIVTTLSATVWFLADLVVDFIWD